MIKKIVLFAILIFSTSAYSAEKNNLISYGLGFFGNNQTNFGGNKINIDFPVGKDFLNISYTSGTQLFFSFVPININDYAQLSSIYKFVTRKENFLFSWGTGICFFEKTVKERDDKLDVYNVISRSSGISLPFEIDGGFFIGDVFLNYSFFLSTNLKETYSGNIFSLGVRF